MEDSKDPFAGLFPDYQPMEDAFPFLKKQRQEQEKLNETLAKQKREQERQTLNELKAATALRDKFALYAMHAIANLVSDFTQAGWPKKAKKAN